MSREPLVIPLPGNQALAECFARETAAELAEVAFRRFPDGEDYIRVATEVAGRDVILACTLHPAAEAALRLLFTADAARDLGARSVGLAVPYLAYMRQDHRFQPGEAITSTYFGRMLSRAVDWLVTVDPHLHRWSSLDQVYSIPSQVVPAAPDIASWLIASVDNPVVVGPDEESEQWVAAVAAAAEAPHTVLRKVRRGDRDVSVSAPEAALLRGRTPVIVDDIISSGRTMIECVKQLGGCDAEAPLCIGTHAVFADAAVDELRALGVRGVVTCNTITHPSNGIDVLPRLCRAAVSALVAHKR